MGVTLFDLGITVLAGLISAVIGVLLYRRIHIGFWGFLSGIASDWPKYFLGLLGATNLHTVLLVTHTAGIVLFPIILVILDILLLEISLLKYLKPLYFILPKSLKSAVKFEKLVERLQHYNTIPRPVRIGAVYSVGVIGGAIHLVINLAIGAL